VTKSVQIRSAAENFHELLVVVILWVRRKTGGRSHSP